MCIQHVRFSNPQMKNQYYIKQGRLLCERKTLILNEKQGNSLCAAHFLILQVLYLCFGAYAWRGWKSGKESQ